MSAQCLSRRLSFRLFFLLSMKKVVCKILLLWFNVTQNLNAFLNSGTCNADANANADTKISEGSLKCLAKTITIMLRQSSKRW